MCQRYNICRYLSDTQIGCIIPMARWRRWFPRKLESTMFCIVRTPGRFFVLPWSRIRWTSLHVERLAEYDRKHHRNRLARTRNCHGPQLTGTCMKNGGVWFHRIRDFEQYRFNGIPSTSHMWGQTHPYCTIMVQ